MQSYLWTAVQTAPDTAWEFSHIVQVAKPLYQMTSANQRKKKNSVIDH